VEEIVICGIGYPSLDWDCILCNQLRTVDFAEASMKSSCDKVKQISEGTAGMRKNQTIQGRVTFMPGITDWRIIQYTNLSQIPFNDRKILDISPVLHRAMLSIISRFEDLAFRF
jgi:hypothetical protein